MHLDSFLHIYGLTMAKTLTFRLKAYRISYLVFSLIMVAFTIFLIASNIIEGINNGLQFDKALDLFTLVAVGLFESGIIAFIIRSLRGGQTILIKHLVFKPDGKPYKFGIILVAVGAVLTLVLGILLATKAMVPDMEFGARMLVVDILFTVFVNLFFVDLYAWVFRHESGTFQII